MTLRAIRLALLSGVAAFAALGCGWMYAEAPSLGMDNRTDGPVMVFRVVDGVEQEIYGPIESGFTGYVRTERIDDCWIGPFVAREAESGDLLEERVEPVCESIWTIDGP